MTSTIDPIAHEIMSVVDGGHVTPIELNKTISKRFRLQSEEVKSVVKRLITAGRLAYSIRHGRTIIEKSFAKPVRISNHVILTPPGVDICAHNKDVGVGIAQGAAFGDGRHPSTRVAVRAIEYVLRDTPFLRQRKESIALDIGTGSGILAITALRLGTTKAIGIDTDPTARYEAVQNAELNGLENRFEILTAPFEEIPYTFDMVIANLRYPTLMRLCLKISNLVKHPGAVVLSGIKIEESEQVMNRYHSHGFACEWKATEKDWCSLVFTI